MKNWFPAMRNRPDTDRVVTTFAYWLISVYLIPACLSFLQWEFYQNKQVLIWTEVIYHGLNFLAMLVIHREYLFYGWLDFRRDWKKHLKLIGICSAAILLVIVPQIWRFGMRGNLYLLPIQEMELMVFAVDAMALSRGLYIAELVLLAPLSVSCMLYIAGFAPSACGRRPWLGYVILAVIVALPRMLNMMLAVDSGLLWSVYLCQLPVHLLCCWAFQKTDTVVVPIGILTVVNLVSSLLLMLLIQF